MEGCLVIKTQILSVFFSTPKLSFPCKDVAFILTISSFFPPSHCRLVELLPFVHIPRYWGIATKCLTYVKTSTDPFVYCLLRQQYRRVLVSIINRVMGKDRYSLSAYSISSTLDTMDDNNCVARIT